MQPANIDTKTPQKAPPSFWLHFSAGGLAGTIGAAATCPLEVVKTRLQSSLYQAPAITTVSTGFRNNQINSNFRLKESREFRLVAYTRRRYALE